MHIYLCIYSVHTTMAMLNRCKNYYLCSTHWSEQTTSDSEIQHHCPEERSWSILSGAWSILGVHIIFVFMLWLGTMDYAKFFCFSHCVESLTPPYLCVLHPWDSVNHAGKCLWENNSICNESGLMVSSWSLSHKQYSIMISLGFRLH